MLCLVYKSELQTYRSLADIDILFFFFRMIKNRTIAKVIYNTTQSTQVTIHLSVNFILFFHVLVPHENFPKSHIINPLLTKLVRSRWLDIGLVLFLRVYGPRLRLGP